MDDCLRQRSDYTYRANLVSGRHGWLRLTPAYSVKIVEQSITEGACMRSGRIKVLDPFCGSATTALVAAYAGHDAVTTDINPFLVWLGRAKTATYRPEHIVEASDASLDAASRIQMGRHANTLPPPMHNIGRWWGPKSLNYLCALRSILDEIPAGSPVRNLLDVAFCRTLIASSNAAFNHQSMSFKNESSIDQDVDHSGMFLQDVQIVLRGAAVNPVGCASVLLSDARNLPAMDERGFDMVVTSPPYANRMSYIRELRPYMYWLRFLTSGRDAGDLDWQAIGGTWGIATSRLSGWAQHRDQGSSCGTKDWASARLADVIEQVASHDGRSATVMSTYIEKYFQDIWAHLSGLPEILTPGSEVHYIVGNSCFYGVLVPVERFYATMLSELGFHDVECRPIRKRNSKKELIEFDVVARWG